MSRRIERLNEQVKREVSDILRFEVRDPRVGVITVTEARVAPDLSIARVYVRRELGKRLKIRTVPELRFEADKALEYGMHIEKLLSEIKKTDEE